MLRDFAGFAGARAYAALALIALGTVLEAVGLLWLVGLARLVIEADRGGAGSQPFPFANLPLSHDQRLLLAVAAFGVLILVRGTVVASRDRLSARLQLGFVEHIKLRLMRMLSDAPYPALARIRHGRIVQALTLDLQQVGVATSFALQSAVALALIAGTCLFTLLLAPLAAVAVALLLAGFAVAWPLMRRAQGLGASLFHNHLRVTEGTLRLLGALKAARAQNLHHRFIDELENGSAAAMRDRVAFMDLQSHARNLWAGLLASAGAAIVALGIVGARLEPEILFGLLVGLSRLSGPAITLHQGLHHVLHGVPPYVSIRALERELHGPAVASAPPLVELVRRDTGLALEFRQVGFVHEESGAGLRDFTLDVAPGAFIGITGPSGAGKTTFIDLAAGILLPQAGMVRAHGVPLAGAALDLHRDRLAYVEQDAFLFEGSLRRNFLMARPGADDARIGVALRLAGAAEIVERIEGGLDGTAGPRGNLVSAGERQRLALACALLREPSLLILDEATNALDLATEQAILTRLAALDPRPTILMVAHRPQSLALCDRILTIRDGMLMEDGAPDTEPGEITRRSAR